MTDIRFIVCLVALAIVSAAFVVLLVAYLRLRQRMKEREAETVAPQPEPEPSAPTLPPTSGELFMIKLHEVLDKHLDNNTLTINDLVDVMGMGRTVFFNRLKSMTGLSPVEYIREQRLKRAAQLLETSRYSITEITYMVGLNDSRYFSRCFKHSYGMTPTEYRQRMQRQ